MSLHVHPCKFIQGIPVYKRKILAAALAAAFGIPFSAHAASDKELAQIREQIQQLKESYEARIQALEKRVVDAEAKADKVQMQIAAAPAPAAVSAAESAPASAPAPRPAAASANAFNPSIALILGGTYANLSQDPNRYRMQGFLPSGDEVGPGKRGLNLGESELTLSANVDHNYSGQLTFSLTPENTVSVEEAFFQSQGLANGLNLKGGRFLSSVGYLNSQHAHAWDFVDAPLAYQAFFGGQYKPDGLQLKWLAPTERFLEVGLEAGRGDAFPGNDRNKNGFGSTAVFAHAGDDIGTNASWRAGLSYLRTAAADRSYEDVDASGTGVTNTFSGSSDIWIADAIYKWSPNGNPTQSNFKLQGEYFHRKEKGTLTYDTLAQSRGTAADSYRAAQSGWYLQGVYQFSPTWRTGLRYDRLNSGTPDIGLVDSGALAAADFNRLLSFHPTRTSLMVDYSASEFSRFRLQLARDQSRPGVTDNQIFLQYIMSLGAHGAHTF